MLKILIVDDEELITEMVKDFLENHWEGEKIEILTANSGIEALDLVGEVDPDFILCDYRMPEMTGGEFVLKIHDKYKLDRNLPVLFVTANPEQAQADCSHLDWVFFLCKPITFDKLIDKVEEVLDTANFPGGN